MTHTMEQLFLSKSKDNKPEVNWVMQADFITALQVVKVIDQGAFTYYMLMKKKNRTDEI